MAGEGEKITVLCSCGKKYRVGAERIGKKFACKDCGATIRVTAEAGKLEETFPEEESPPKKAPKKGTDRKAKPAAGRRREAGDARDEEARGAKRAERLRDRRREAKKTSPAAAVVVLILGLAVGAGAAIAAIAFLGETSAEEK
ncbi:MAG: hypothetical protein HY720_27840 [Planctomycetes bacterium]|nr:hypothetical protein [Planctomycetota bacterium]